MLYILLYILKNESFPNESVWVIKCRYTKKTKNKTNSNVITGGIIKAFCKSVFAG